MSTTTKNDRVVIEARKAYLASDVAKYDRLMAAQTKWQRKRTIANNKLEEVRKEIDALLKNKCDPEAKGYAVEAANEEKK